MESMIENWIDIEYCREMVHMIMDDKSQEIGKTYLVEEEFLWTKMNAMTMTVMRKYYFLGIMESFDKFESHFASNKMLPEHIFSIQRSQFSIQMHDQIKPNKIPLITTFIGTPRPK